MITYFTVRRIVTDLDRAHREGWKFGAKTVRGAYMHGERARAQQLGYADPIHPTIDATHASYNGCVAPQSLLPAPLFLLSAAPMYCVIRCAGHSVGHDIQASCIRNRYKLRPHFLSVLFGFSILSIICCLEHHLLPCALMPSSCWQSGSL